MPSESEYSGMPVCLKKTMLRACKILYSFFANPVTNKNTKTALG